MGEMRAPLPGRRLEKLIGDHPKNSIRRPDNGPNRVGNAVNDDIKPKGLHVLEPPFRG